MGNIKCSKSKFEGLCCCNCSHQLTLMKHPSNTNFGRGSISEKCGYACAVMYGDGSNEGTAIFSDRQHGMCEMYNPK